MGCGCSKEDVAAAGNSRTRRLLRNASSAIASKKSSTDAATSTKAINVAVEVEGAPALTSSSEEYFSSDMESEGATGYYSPYEDSAAQVIAEAHAVRPAEESGAPSDSAEDKEASEADNDEELKYGHGLAP